MGHHTAFYCLTAVNPLYLEIGFCRGKKVTYPVALQGFILCLQELLHCVKVTDLMELLPVSVPVQRYVLFRKKSAKVKTGYKREHINLGCDMDFDIAGPSIRGALVVGYEGWLAGYQMTFETTKSRVTQSNFAVGYKTDEFQLHTNV